MLLFRRPLSLLLAGFSLLLVTAAGAKQFNFYQAGAAGADSHHLADDEAIINEMHGHHLDRLADIEPTHDLQALSNLPCEAGFAGSFPCDNVDLLAFMPLNTIGGGQGNDIWGWTDPQTGREYALMGRTNGTAFVDITDPVNPIYLGNLPTHSSNSTWRDIKVYADHAFVVSEASLHGMQVFDLTQLRQVVAPPVTFSATAHYNQLGRAHNVAINEASGYAYAVGVQQGAQTCSGGLHMINIQNPTSPTFAGCYALDGYIHDTQCVIYSGPDSQYHGREICFNSNGSNVNNAFTIVDVTSKSSPARLAQSGYPGSRYAHQGWLTEDHRYFLLDDELDEQHWGHNTRTYIWDVSELQAPFLVGYYNGVTGAIDHNQYIVGDFAYQANYRSGLRILDIRAIGAASLTEVGYFDVYPASNSANFNGAWSVYPFFASGVVVVSGIEQGLFVLQPRLAPLLSLTKSEPEGALLVGETITYTVTLANNGFAAATGVVVTDTLNGVPLVLDGPDTIEVDSSATYYFVYEIQPEDCAGGLTNWVSANSQEGATAALAEPVVTAVACPGLQISKSPPAGVHLPGEVLTYTITVTNSGNTAVTGLVVTDTLNGLSQVVPGPESLAPAEVGSYLFYYPLEAADCGAVLENWAEVAGQEITAQVDAPQLTTINCPPPLLAISVAQSNATAVVVGEMISYTITITNQDSWAASDVVVTATVNGQAVVIAAPALIAGNSAVQTIFARTVDDESCGTDWEVWVAVSSGNGSWAIIEEAIITAVVCDYKLFLPLYMAGDA